MNDETRQKKMYLKRYRNYLVRIARLEEKLVMIDNRLVGLKATTISDMPRGGGKAQTCDDLLIKKEETQQRIQNLVDISATVRQEIYCALDTVDDYRFAEVLECYFIDCQTFEAIANKLNYSVQHVGYLYGVGLDKVHFPKR